MAIRAQPVKPVFQRMSRIVREIADVTGKSVRLITEGENTVISDGATAVADSAGTGAANAGAAGIASGAGLGSVPSKARRPKPASWMWSCDWPYFPSSKDATVHVRVTVDARGRATHVDVVNATHADFVAVAKECALRSRYTIGLNDEGEPAETVTDALPIHYREYD